MTPRDIALRALLRSYYQRVALSRSLADLEGILTARDHAFAQQLSFGLCRYFHHVEAIETRLVKTRIKPRNFDVRLIILLGLYQLIYLQIPAYAAISESVNLAHKRNKNWAKGLVNGILREFERQREQLLQQVDHIETAHYAHPSWMLQAFRQAWPEKFSQIIEYNNSHPPQILRVNSHKISRSDYLSWLAEQAIQAYPAKHSPVGVIIDSPRPSYDIPGYDQGWVSIQDGAPQLAAYLMQLAPGQRVLDACAAPGGKTSHMLEVQPDLAELVALDRDPDRVDKIRNYLDRLNVNANIHQADALKPHTWWDGYYFDRILLDVPCSATGVIRRHPDIKLIRLVEEIEQMAEEQQRFLDRIWPLLQPGGILVYATCSLMPAENHHVIEHFLQKTPDAQLLPIDAEWGVPLKYGRQIIPNSEQDGFYYARLKKQGNNHDQKRTVRATQLILTETEQ